MNLINELLNVIESILGIVPDKKDPKQYKVPYSGLVAIILLAITSLTIYIIYLNVKEEFQSLIPLIVIIIVVVFIIIYTLIIKIIDYFYIKHLKRINKK
mgnify:CR=1 FL=1